MAIRTQYSDRVQKALSEAAAEYRAVGDDKLAGACQRPHAERLPDGSLLLYTIRPDHRVVSITVPAGDWTSTAQQLGKMQGWTKNVPPCVLAREAIHGGEYIEEVKIDYDAVPGLVELTQATLSSWHAENAEGLAFIAEREAFPFLHEVMSGGCLRCTAVSPLGRLTTMDIPADHWQRT